MEAVTRERLQEFNELVPLGIRNQVSINRIHGLMEIVDTATEITEEALDLYADTLKQHNKTLSLDVIHKCYTDTLTTKLDQTFDNYALKHPEVIRFRSLYRTIGFNVYALQTNLAVKSPYRAATYLVMHGLTYKGKPLPIAALSLDMHDIPSLVNKLPEIIWCQNRPYIPQAWLCQHVDRLIDQNIDLVQVDLEDQTPVWTDKTCYHFIEVFDELLNWNNA